MAADAPLSDRILIVVGGGVLLIVALVAIVGEVSPAWKRQQAFARAQVAERAGDDLAASMPTGIQQLWIPILDRVDRCVTCHAAIESGQALAEADHPARSHPHTELLAAHPIEQFGCTLCHGGQGAATTTEAAHGDVPFWEEPLLGTARAKSYDLTVPELMAMRCNTCHQQEEHVEGMALMNEAKALVVKLKCARCHSIQGKGASKAPDLTREGDKHPSQFHFPEGWGHEHTALAWHIEHFLDPQAVTPNSEMPKYALSRRQATALALLVLSWRKQDMPAAWTPGAAR